MVACLDLADGAYTDSAGVRQGLLVTRSGTSWTATPAPLPASAEVNTYARLSSAACPSAASCVAVGDYTAAAAEPAVPGHCPKMSGEPELLLAHRAVPPT